MDFELDFAMCHDDYDSVFVVPYDDCPYPICI